METTLVTLHSLIRWLVLLAGLAAAGRAIYGLLSRAPWQELDNRLGLLFTISLDLQVLLGLVLYFLVSPITTQNFSNFGEAMGNPAVRFYLVEHSAIMIVALALAHVGRSRAKKAENAVAKRRYAATFFALALLAILAGIPWDRLG
jgi:hypothetical protein